MTSTPSKDDISLLLSELRLLLTCDMKAATVKIVHAQLKKDYVSSRHQRKISPISPCKAFKNGGYKTYVYVGNKRSSLTAVTEEALFEKLYIFYFSQETKEKTLEQAFELLMEYKKDCKNRKEKTIKTDRGLFRHIARTLIDTNIREITDESIQKYIVSDLLPTRPSKNQLKRLLGLINQVFTFAIRKKYCSDNPMRFIDITDYYPDCKDTEKTDEERAFSMEELDKIVNDAEKTLENPRSQMKIFSKETGVRLGELPAIWKEDVDLENGYVHIHRQQVKEGNKLIEVPYTKNERKHPRGGRKIPLTEKAKQIIEIALATPGESNYLFHDANKAEWVKKDSYVQNLRRSCERLGCTATNNHAFRIAFNSRLIDLGIEASDRALILGHEVQTNENHYSVTDNRRLEDIKNRLNKKEP